jgi:hypothetical protein
MAERHWRGDKEWEEIRRLGKGRQSEVFLVRNSVRIAERKRHLEKLKELAGQGFNEVPANLFAREIRADKSRKTKNIEQSNVTFLHSHFLASGGTCHLL